MTLTVTIPDEFSEELAAGFGDPARAALAAEAYEKAVMSLNQVRRMLGLEAQELLARHGAWPALTEEDFESDLAVMKKLREPA